MSTFTSRLLCLTLVTIHSTALAIPTPHIRVSDPDGDVFTLDVIHGAHELGPVLDMDFPDPSIVQGKDGGWYAFATNGGSKAVQVARSDDPLGGWEVLEHDGLSSRAWTSGRHTWAPDVRELDDGSYVMYFSGEVPGSHRHCIGVARSLTVGGPYEPDPEPWLCPLDRGGAIDASGFRDEATGERYVVYKVDGNSMGPHNACSADAEDEDVSTPLMLQRVDDADGATKIGDPVVLLDRVPELDGPLVEAPNLVRRGSDGMYILFYSSHCFSDERYDVKYAYSETVEGPYIRAPDPLLQAPDLELDAPGGMTAARIEGDDGEPAVDFIVFHANCLEKARCMYAVRYGF